MVESPVAVEWYLSQMREKIKYLLQRDDFIGNIKFEVSIKNKDIVNMNVETKDSLKFK